MNPGKYDIRLQKGATFSLTMQATDDQGAINFAATYNKAELKVWPAWAVQKGISGNPLLEFSTTNFRIGLGVADLTLGLNMEETIAISFTEGVYELKLINDLVLPVISDTLLTGKFFVEGLS